MENNNVNKILNIIDDNAKTLVGVMLKRIEVLEKEKVLTPSLYKALIRELIYENSRYFKKLIKAQLTIGKIVFKEKPRE